MEKVPHEIEMHPKKLVWYAPTWSTAPKQWWALRKYILSAGPLVRMTVASALAVALVLIVFKLAIPGLVFPNLWPLLLVLPLLVAGVTLQTYILSRMKARVLVSRKKIIISHGQTATIIKPAWLTRVRLAIHEGDRARIRFCYEKAGKLKSTSIGISDDCDLHLLERLLPVEIDARDFRRRRND